MVEDRNTGVKKGTITEVFYNPQRMLFINGQVVKGNLKRKRIRRMTEVFNRIAVREEINKLSVNWLT